jgi:hypothetical protein
VGKPGSANWKSGIPKTVSATKAFPLRKNQTLHQGLTSLGFRGYFPSNQNQKDAPMNLAAIKKMEIIDALAHVPDADLDKIKTYLDTIIAESGRQKAPSRSLKGIWKDKGFEKITELENEVREARSGLADSILKKQL